MAGGRAEILCFSALHTSMDVQSSLIASRDSRTIGGGYFGGSLREIRPWHTRVGVKPDRGHQPLKVVCQPDAIDPSGTGTRRASVARRIRHLHDGALEIDVKICVRRRRETAPLRDDDPFVRERPRHITPQYIAGTVEWATVSAFLNYILGVGGQKATNTQLARKRGSYEPHRRTHRQGSPSRTRGGSP